LEDWEDALNTFLMPWKEQDNVIGALVCGSFVTGNPTEHSDLDVHIILSDETDWRERGNRIINGFLVEYFANPVSRIRDYFREDHQDHRHMAAVQFVTGRVLFDTDGAVRQLKAEAEEWVRKPLVRPEQAAVELAQYALWDNLDNLQEAFDRQSPDVAYVYHHVLARIYEAYARYLGHPTLSYYQQYRILQDPNEGKRKYLMDPFPDAGFVQLFLNAVAETDVSRMLAHAEGLTDHALSSMGGFDVDGFRFRSPAK
jgi:hypothetical protein